VFSTFCSIFSCNPSFISTAHPSATSCAHPSRRRHSVAPSLFPGAVGQKKEKRKERKQSKKGKRIQTKNERLSHSPSGKGEPIRLSEGDLRHSFPWLGSFLGCTVHALVAISPRSCYVPPHRAFTSPFQYHILSLTLL
jgi:hypothetical protein